MKLVNIQQAKTHLSRLVEDAVAGEEIVIAKAGQPFVRLVPCRPERTSRTLGGWEGKVQIPANFDDEDPMVTELFGGKPARPSGKTRRRVRRQP